MAKKFRRYEWVGLWMERNAKEKHLDIHRLKLHNETNA
jgi:hypothetical protein